MTDDDDSAMDEWASHAMKSFADKQPLIQVNLTVARVLAVQLKWRRCLSQARTGAFLLAVKRRAPASGRQFSSTQSVFNSMMLLKMDEHESPDEIWQLPLKQVGKDVPPPTTGEKKEASKKPSRAEKGLQQQVRRLTTELEVETKRRKITENTLGTSQQAVAHLTRRRTVLHQEKG